MNLRDLITDEKGKLSSARVGLWVTVALALLTVGVDIALTLGTGTPRIPNPVYALEATMFTVFASWAAGARIAQYLGPQLGAIAQGIGAANRDKPRRKPFPGMDQNEHGG